MFLPWKLPLEGSVLFVTDSLSLELLQGKPEMFDILINSSKSNWHTNNSGPGPCAGEEETEMCMWLEGLLLVSPPFPNTQALIFNIKWTWNFLCETNLTLRRKTFNFKAEAKIRGRMDACRELLPVSAAVAGIQTMAWEVGKRPPRRATHAWKRS